MLLNGAYDVDIVHDDDNARGYVKVILFNV